MADKKPDYDPEEISLGSFPPAYRMPQFNTQENAQVHESVTFESYRGQVGIHGVQDPINQPAPPPDEVLLRPMDHDIRPDKLKIFEHPVPVEIVQNYERREIIKSRYYSISIQPGTTGPDGLFSNPTLLFGRDLRRTRWWVRTNVPAGQSLYLNNTQDNYDAWPLTAADGLQGAYYDQDAVWVFGNNQQVNQVFVKLEYSIQLEP